VSSENSDILTEGGIDRRRASCWTQRFDVLNWRCWHSQCLDWRSDINKAISIKAKVNWPRPGLSKARPRPRAQGQVFAIARQITIHHQCNYEISTYYSEVRTA